MLNIGDKVKINFENLNDYRGDKIKLKQIYNEDIKVITDSFISFAGFRCYSLNEMRGTGFTEDELTKVIK